MSTDSSYVCKLSKEIQEKAERELNEESKRRSQSLEIIKEWISQQPHLHAKTDDVYLLRFLRNCKYSLELTKEKIDRFYTMRNALTEWFTNRDPSDLAIENILDQGIYLILPGYDKEGRKVVCLRLGAVDPSTFDMDSFQKLEQMIGDLLLDEEQVQVTGICTITDASNFSGSHLSLFNLSIVKKQMMIWQSCNPIRIRCVNIFNESPLFHNLMELFKLFTKDKMKKRLAFHGKNMNSLYENVPREMLPEEYGGTAGTIEDLIVQTKKQLINRKVQFIDEENYGVDETKRPGKPKTKEDMFGVDGSFRKLNID